MLMVLQCCIFAQYRGIYCKGIKMQKKNKVNQIDREGREVQQGRLAA